MTTYLFPAIWLVSHVVCNVLARRRGIRPGTPATMLYSLLGPLAIPLVLATQPTPVRL